MSEEWRIVPSNHRYQVSSEGRLKRVAPSTRGGPTWVGRILKPKLNRYGYLVYTLGNGGRGLRPREHTAHSLVAEAFIGPRPDGLTVNHRDGIKTNNRPENLEYVTNQENLQHAQDTGHWIFGDDNGRAKLTPQEVRWLRDPRLADWSILALAQIHHVHFSTIARVRRGEGWPE